MFEALRDAGVRRVRLTGGEPLLHPRSCRSSGASPARLRGSGPATNASQLARLAGPLPPPLHRLNVSIDTLDPGRFHEVTRGGELAPVLDGIDAAIAAGFSPIKLNTVVLRGVNDDEIERLALWAWRRRMVPRFLEVMPIAEGARLVGKHLVTAAEMRARLAEHLLPEEAAAEPGLGPARYVRARRDPSLRVGFIRAQRRSARAAIACASPHGRAPAVPRHGRRRRRLARGEDRRSGGDPPAPGRGVAPQAGRQGLEGLHRRDGLRGVDPRDRRLKRAGGSARGPDHVRLPVLGAACQIPGRCREP